MKNKKICFFDLETQKSIKEVSGDLTILGISVAVTRQDKINHVYYEKDIPQLIEQLENADLIVGHNHVRFDYSVLKGYGFTNEQYDKLSDKSYDTLAVINKMIGHRISLEHLSKYNLRGAPKKLASGLKCIDWYKEGKLDKIAELCADDVARLSRIFSLIVSGVPLKILEYWNEKEKFKETKLKMPIPEMFRS